MSGPSRDEKFVGIQLGPISVVDEGVEPLLDMLLERFGINALMLGTVSWLGLKVGRRVSTDLEGWPDHGKQSNQPLKGGSFLHERPQYYRRTIIDRFRAPDEELNGIDILEHVLPHSRARGMRLYIDLMEPMFAFAGHGSANTVDVPNLPQLLQVDSTGAIASEPCLNNPDYRNWLHAVVEDHARNYDIDGVMWCNERRSPLDAALVGLKPHCFCRHCSDLAHAQNIDVERARAACHNIWETVTALRRGVATAGGGLVKFLSAIFQNPEALVWERFWVERNKMLDRELFGIMKFCKPNMEFGLNVWNRNHLNLWRKAQWPWAELADSADWVKPIAYQHQTGGVFADEMAPFLDSMFRELGADLTIELVKAGLGLQDEAGWSQIVQKGFDADSYVFNQAQETLAAVEDKVSVYMGVGVDAPRSRANQAICTPDIVRRSVLASYRAGAQGVIFGPAYAGMNLATLDGGAAALRELGLA